MLHDSLAIARAVKRVIDDFQASPEITIGRYDITGGYAGGLLVLSSALVLEALLVLSLKLPSLDESATGKGST